MSTRALTRVRDEFGIVMCLYRHSDGYPEGHGRELVEFLDGFAVVDGLFGGKIANGASCLAAQIVAHFKRGPGQFYLWPPDCDSSDCEYVYDVRAVTDNPIRITCMRTKDLAVIHDGEPAFLRKAFDATA